MKKRTALVMALSLAAFCVGVGAVYDQHIQNRNSAAAFETLSNQLGVAADAQAEQAASATPVASAMPIASASPEDQLSGVLPSTDDPILLAYREKAEAYPDFIGWLTIDGTEIDYPVMRSPDEAERYLHRDFEGNYSRAGTPFMLPISDPSVPNENIIIYAHHMKDGSMFGGLPVYDTLEGFTAHQRIRFDTLYARGEYQVIAAFRTSIGAEDEFPYYRYEWLDDEATFDRYMRGVMANRLYDTGETASYGDQLLSLSTCDYHEPNGRLVVVAKRIQETEETSDE
ncbi:class B sortase [Eubacteriales bacterium OttesenSCG-928-A19]|nr:class B sortase [Eubacteriales bacterium OttesenSCG-928-A19]